MTDRDDRQADLLDEYWAAGGDQQVPGLDVGIAAVARVLVSELRAEPPRASFAATLRGQLETQAANRAVRPRPLQRIPRWLALGLAAAVLAALALSALVVREGRGHAVSAEQIMRNVATAVTSPESQGVRSFSMTTVTNFAGWIHAVDGEEHRRVWYETPGRQRVEVDSLERREDGSEGAVTSTVYVWDGAEAWTYAPGTNTAIVTRQGPADIEEMVTQGRFSVLGGAWGADNIESLLRLAAVCYGSPRLTGEAVVAGRAAYIVDLGLPQCSMGSRPGFDGRREIWVDQETAFVLKDIRYALDGRVTMTREVTSIEYNQPVDDERFTLALPPDVEVTDYRSSPGGAGSFLIRPTKLASIEEARASATFDVQAPTAVPAGYVLQSVEQWWPDTVDEQARRDRSVHADFVEMRWANARGDWVAVTQGFLPNKTLAWYDCCAPADHKGTVTVDGREARWITGMLAIGSGPYSPHPTRWLPDIDFASVGWEAGIDGDSHRSVAIDSNALSIEELVAVARSME